MAATVEVGRWRLGRRRAFGVYRVGGGLPWWAFGLYVDIPIPGKEDMFPDPISNSMGLFLQKTNIIRDYLEDIDEMPRSRMFWPRQIWSKYVNKLEVVLNEPSSKCRLLEHTSISYMSMNGERCTAAPVLGHVRTIIFHCRAVRLTIAFNRKLKAYVVSLFLSFALTPGSEAHSRLVAYLPK
nr:squalene synthase [Tanacetum cinerariifolium]